MNNLEKEVLLNASYHLAGKITANMRYIFIEIQRDASVKVIVYFLDEPQKVDLEQMDDFCKDLHSGLYDMNPVNCEIRVSREQLADIEKTGFCIFGRYEH